MAGLRAHKGEIVGEAQWPAIFDRATWERLQPLFRRQAKGRPPTNLLTSLLTCGVCGRRLHSSTRTVGQQRRRRYACNPQPGSGRCGWVTIEAEPIEALVTEAVLTALDGDGLHRALHELDGQADAVKDIAEQLRADELALEQLAADYYTDRLISRAEYFAAREGLQRRIDSLRARLDTNKDRASLRRLVPSGGRIRDAWESADVEWRRSLIGAVLERIEIQPAQGRTVFDPARVALRWRF